MPPDERLDELLDWQRILGLSADQLAQVLHLSRRAVERRRAGETQVDDRDLALIRQFAVMASEVRSRSA